VTTSILDFEKLKKHLPPELAAELPVAPPVSPESQKPVSMQDLLDRARTLFTPEEAENLARRIEEGRAQAHD
jgi:hypothetical protein